jgi:hypothetical protein
MLQDTHSLARSLSSLLYLANWAAIPDAGPGSLVVRLIPMSWMPRKPRTSSEKHRSLGTERERERERVSMCVRAWMRAWSGCVHVCMRGCVGAWVRTFACACVKVWAMKLSLSLRNTRLLSGLVFVCFCMRVCVSPPHLCRHGF